MRRRKNCLPGDEENQAEFSRVSRPKLRRISCRRSNLKLKGEANDTCKGLSGGTIAIAAGLAASRRGDVLAGNTVLYGATLASSLLLAVAGERFAVRNSGALAVVEGVGQHGLRVHDRGVAIILGPLGLNFGSGMTGGLRMSCVPKRRCASPRFS